METNEVESAVEALMDKHGVEKFLEAVAHVLDLKAGHINDNWQDRPMANRFLNASRMVFKAVDKVSP